MSPRNVTGRPAFLGTGFASGDASCNKSFVCVLFHAFIPSLSGTLLHAMVHPFIQSPSHVLRRSFIHSFVHAFTHPSMHAFILTIFRLFIQGTCALPKGQVCMIFCKQAIMSLQDA